MSVRNSLNVIYKGRVVGILALTKDGKAAFEYNDEWLKSGFSISPFSLPLKKQVFVPTISYFKGLFGAFADSLPDAWGNILLNRMLKENGINPDDITILDRLAIVGNSGMGAIDYHPFVSMKVNREKLSLDELARQCKQILAVEKVENLDELYHLGGTSGGARPKIMTEVDGSNWIIKFPAQVDNIDIGKMEYDYSICAKKCGIVMTETKLYPSKECQGYFGTKRFDIVEKFDEYGNKKFERRHTLTVAAILELDSNEPSLDYHSLMKLTKILTMNDETDVENMFRRMCFNVFAHNRDDHSKNFSFIYDDSNDRWRLSPAYDLTYSSTYYGEHTTSVNGNGKNPSTKDLLEVGKQAGMNIKKCEKIIDEIYTCVHEMLQEYINI